MEDSGTPGAVKPPRTRNPRGQGSRLRADIVTAAVEILDEAGDEHAVTLRSVARRVGIAAPSIYNHFPDQSAIMLAISRQSFAELEDRLRASVEEAGDDPRARLYAVCHAYLEYARSHPERYRTMFGGLWKPTLGDNSLTQDELRSLGREAMQIFVDALVGCVAGGCSTSTDPFADTVALWLGLHGLAHQRALVQCFPWPSDITERIITAHAHLKA